MSTRNTKAIQRTDNTIMEIDNVPESIGAIIKKIRTRHRHSQRELGELIDLSHSSIAKYERGEVVPSIKNLCKILSFYDVSLSRFFTEVDKLRKLD